MSEAFDRINVQNDPVNFIDPYGLEVLGPGMTDGFVPNHSLTKNEIAAIGMGISTGVMTGFATSLKYGPQWGLISGVFVGTVQTLTNLWVLEMIEYTADQNMENQKQKDGCK